MLALLVVIWLLSAMIGRDEPSVQSAAADQPATSTSSAPSSSSATSAAGATTSPSASASQSGTPTSTTGATTSQPPPPPAPPQPCPDQAIAVAAQVAAPEYRVGQKPEFRLVVTNAGKVPCVRDLGASLQELLVFAADGVTRLWSSNDCYPGNSDDVRTLQPSQQVVFPVKWAGRSSKPQCAGQRVTVQAGDYLVVAKLGALASQPTPFRLVR